MLMALASVPYHRCTRHVHVPYTPIPDICLFFSTRTIFGSTFLHTKARKSLQNRFRDKRSVNCDKTDFAKKNASWFMWRSLSCGNISPHDRFLHISPHTHILLQNHVESFLYVIDFLHISHVEKLLHMTICRMEKFIHMTDFSPQAPLVVLVTNIRYGGRWLLSWNTCSCT